MGNVDEMTEQQRQVAELLRDLEALPPGHQLRGEELMSFIRRLPKLDLPENWTSADDIREFRGPLPEDDPEYQRNILGRR
ncbi:MAG TPA: hypothetical protein VNI54_04585 [Thermoanaerobaculia bacterium]|nr:hypothetical protein [Thermoanaerobaculia bacterium]